MNAQELLQRAKPHITRLIPWETPNNGCSGFYERTDMLEAISIAGAGRPDVVIDALRLLKRVTGSQDLREWQKYKTDQDIRHSFDRAAEM